MPVWKLRGGIFSLSFFLWICVLGSFIWIILNLYSRSTTVRWIKIEHFKPLNPLKLTVKLLPLVIVGYVFFVVLSKYLDLNLWNFFAEALQFPAAACRPPGLVILGYNIVQENKLKYWNCKQNKSSWLFIFFFANV